MTPAPRSEPPRTRFASLLSWARAAARSPLLAVRGLLPRPPLVRDLDLEDASSGRGPVRIPPGYVFFRGHFEGMPMLPGVAQLTEIVLPLVRRAHPEAGALVAVRRLRFRRPVLPGETVHVELRSAPPSDVRFELTVGGHVVASGAMTFEGALAPAEVA